MKTNKNYAMHNIVSVWSYEKQSNITFSAKPDRNLSIITGTEVVGCPVNGSHEALDQDYKHSLVIGTTEEGRR